MASVLAGVAAVTGVQCHCQLKMAKSGPSMTGTRTQIGAAGTAEGSRRIMVADCWMNADTRLPAKSRVGASANWRPSEFRAYSAAATCRCTDHPINSGRIAGGLGVATGVFLIFFLGEVPRVRNDILRRFPFLDSYFDRTPAPEDNVSVDSEQA